MLNSFREYELKILMHFLSFRPESSLPVLLQFSLLDNAVVHLDGGKNNFVYVPGKRSDRALLIAHADTVWDTYYYQSGKREDDVAVRQLRKQKHRPVIRDGIISQRGWKEWGLGADDRAGCAMLWLLKNSGHSLLVTDGEEHGQIGANYLIGHYPGLAEELNGHSYMIQFDRRGNNDYKTYRLPVTDEFRSYIEEKTGFCDAGMTARTDIVALCKKICGVNLSIGYHNEHKPQETLVYRDWLNTYRIAERLLRDEQPGFPLCVI